MSNHGDGQPLHKLPKGQAEQTQTWKQRQKNLEQALNLQKQRLERAMITQQVWTAEAYHRLHHHPLTKAMVQALIWGWREDAEQPWIPLTHHEKGGDYKLMHPLEWQAEPSRWQPQTPDPQPFPQITREIFLSQPEDWAQLQPPRWHNRQVNGPALWKLSQSGRWQAENEGELVWRYATWEVSLDCEYQSWAWRENKQCEIFALQTRGPQGKLTRSCSAKPCGIWVN